MYSFASMQRGYHHDDLTRIRVLLMHARMLALHGICSGVCTLPPDYGVRFGTSSATLFSSDETMPSDTFAFDSMRWVDGVSEIRFAARSAEVTNAGSVRWVDNVGTSTCSVNRLGRIICARE